MNFDDVLDQVGGFGLYQKWVFVLTCIIYTFPGFYILNPVFLLGTPLHRCAIPGYDNDTYAIQSEHHRELVNQSIPPSDIDTELYDRCHLYAPSDEPGPRYDVENSTVVSCDRWVYDRTVYKETFVSQVDLVCDKEVWVANAEMLLYFGMLVGSLASGIFADRYGRKPVMYVAILLMAGSAIGLAFSPTYAVFVTLQFILGTANICAWMPAYIISFEMTSAQKRMWPGVIGDFPYIVGVILYAAIAYALQDWFYIQLYVGLPSAIGILYWWLMPESPRWLLLKGRVKEAETIIRRMARWNKARLPDKLFDQSAVAQEAVQGSSESILGLFTSRTMLIRSLLIFFNWAVVAFAYFGLALNTDNLNGNVYLNFGVSGAVEIPATILVIALVDRVGRRRLYTATMMVGGVSCISTLLAVEYAKGNVYLNFGLARAVEIPATLLVILLVDRVGRRRLYTATMMVGGVSCISTLLAVEYTKDITSLPVVLAMIGRLCVSAGYVVQYVHSAELFPTVLRNAGLGCASVFARIGTMVAPYIVNLGEHIGGTSGEAFPLIVFGGMAFLSAMLSLLLPETLNRNLPETVEDGERFGKSGAFYFVRSFRMGLEYERLRDGENTCELSRSREQTYEALRESMKKSS